MQPYPEWLSTLAWAYLSLCLLSALAMIIDELAGNRQHMMIMNFVWPITALYGGPVALWGYLTAGRAMTHRRKQRERAARGDRAGNEREETQRPGPTRSQVAVSVTHCGAGCTLGDIGGESWVFIMALVFAGGEFGTRLVMDFLLAWLFGVFFQYFTIAPMRGLSFGEGILAAIRADTLSIVAFQIGLFGWMALSFYVIFPEPRLRPDEGLFWFMMQIGMMIGFFTSYPANVFLLKAGWKEKMG